MGRQWAIRQELIEAEKKANYYAEWVYRHSVVSQHTTWYSQSLDLYHFYMSRRRFFLRDLLRTQLKEFDYERAETGR